ncbi:xanthine dehydrogenase family protein molybdopterin-binding subunit [Celeribacter marinus]|uniref:xanthine dehydrogenase family protein molybdopterin-binding subunit n=1 Tax=Celeribacter marinus TaxID=1397108 RepID=UPI003F6B2927
MDKFGKSQPVKRREDTRFLTGRGRYVDDIAPEGSAVAYILRSPVAHAEITELDVSDARDAEGVLAVLTFDDLAQIGLHPYQKGEVITNADGTPAADPKRPILAEGRVRYVGEPIACVIAETLAQAKDAAELIAFDFDDLPVHVGLETGGPQIHDEAPDNIAYDYEKGNGATVAAVMATAAHRVTVPVMDNRVLIAPMEPRGAYAEWGDDGRVHLCFGGQGVWGMKDDLADNLGIDRERVRITNPDVGGGFGLKGMPFPEYFMIAAASKYIARPVRWMSERTEGMLSDHAGRDLISTCELGFDADHKLIAYSVDTISNLGAYNSHYGQPIQSELFEKVLMGTYDCQAAFLRVRGIYTNTSLVDAYRGAGRPEAIFALERAMDQAARELGVDPVTLRRKNFIAVDAFPYRTATGELYDVGDFNKVMDRGLAEADWDGFAARKAASEAAGKLRGRGLCYYIESILGDPDEWAHVEFRDDGGVNLYVGTQSNGQGHETVYAQFLADQTGIPAALIDVIQGDSDRIPSGGGTGGSRSVTTQNNATLKTVGTLITNMSAFLKAEFGGEVTFDDERFRVEGTNETPTMLEAAALARDKGRDDLLSVREQAEIEGRSYPNGCHIAEVEIDPETGETKVVKYSVADDFGNLINPMLAEGQVHGGVAQGIGQALTELCVYDDEGQLVTASFMDYAMPRADDMPFVKFVSEPVPSTHNVMGMKGCGEAGTVGALAAVANAVADTLWPLGVRRIDMPFTPQKVWRAVNGAKESEKFAAQ